MFSTILPIGSLLGRLSLYDNLSSVMQTDVELGDKAETESSQDELSAEQLQKPRQSKKQTLDQRSPQKQQQEVLI